MAGHGTIIGKLADAIGRERECGAAALHDDSVGARSILVDDHVVLGALAVDQVDLHELAFMHDELRIALPLMSPPTPRKTMRPSAMPERSVNIRGLCGSPPCIPA